MTHKDKMNTLSQALLEICLALSVLKSTVFTVVA